MNKISVASYMGSGSSAVTDLLSEYEMVCCPQENFEYIFLHCPNGVFDLEDKLLRGNNALRSDEAIRSFRKAMAELYGNGRWWFAGYETKLTPSFMVLVDDFIESITECTFEGYWYQQEKISRVQHVVNKCKQMAGVPRFDLFAERLVVAYPEPNDFYRQASNFINKALEAKVRDSENDGKVLLIDQLFLPHNLHRLDYYFPDDSLKVVSVSRDPRDVYILNKYRWHPQGCPIPIPEEPEAFCLYYSKMRKVEQPYTGKQVLPLQFEDLVFHYEETTAKIEDFCAGLLGAHIDSRKRFDPNVSIANIGVFSSDEKFEEEAAYIAKRLPQYLYSEMDQLIKVKPHTAIDLSF